ncbi:MAG: formylglycine-generating enzyme family protein [Nitrospirota bacterium]|nr:formylglycine-generating enzyme family protein [Nitrospirota bacterium]
MFATRRRPLSPKTATLRTLLLCAALLCAATGTACSTAPRSAEAASPRMNPADTSPPKGMVLVPAGPFIMGTDRTDDGEAASHGLPYTFYSDATPQHKPELAAFYIDRNEMTNAEYLQFLNDTEIPLGTPYGWEADDRYPDGQGAYPVTGLNWYEAYLVCQYFGKRLPGEAEWEKAARGTDGRLYPWGNKFRAGVANVATTAQGGRLMPVGSFPEGASPYGVMDMVGNAWEWTRDWYTPYPGSTFVSDNYGKQFKVIRGNSFSAPGHFPDDELAAVIGEMSRANYRFSFNPKGRFRDSGVRCAKSVKVTASEQADSDAVDSALGKGK